MHLSNIGVLADIFWNEITHHTKNVKLTSFVVMPNHIHGIIELTENTVSDNKIMHRIHVQSSGIVDVVGLIGTIGIGGTDDINNINIPNNNFRKINHKQLVNNDFKTLEKIQFHP